VLVVWVVLMSVYAIRSPAFPASRVQGRAAVALTAVLIIVTVTMAVVTARTPPGVQPYNTGVATDGLGPALTPVSAVTPATSGPIQLSANPTGVLRFNTNTLTATSTHVVIDFTNKSPLAHNVTIANAAGKVLGATPTFQGGSRTLTLTLPAGTYTYYCSVPGHEQAGMKGTLTVKPSSTTTSPPSTSSGQLALAANPTGLLAYNTKTLTATSTHVVIDFTNKSPLAHNVTIANTAGKVLGATPTFQGGSRTLTLTLPAGTYTYYCSVPGHEQAGMKGTLTVR
jgi:plastocyanin